MKTREIEWKKIAEELGLAMILAWTLFFGPVGAVVLLAIAYSMFTQNLALGIMCGLLLFAPLMLTMVWYPFAWATLHAEVGLEAQTPPVRQPIV